MRRGTLVILALGVLLTGTVNILSTVIGWLGTPPPSPGPAELQLPLAGFGEQVAVDYLSWDSAARPARHAALARYAEPDARIDGWDGNGRQWADSPSTIGITANGGSESVVTVRVRIIPAVPAERDTPPPPPSAGVPPEPAPVPGPEAPGWMAGPARWATLAVPVRTEQGRHLVIAAPVLVGSPPPRVPLPSLPSSNSNEDATFGTTTREIVLRQLRSYSEGELEFVRASGSSFTGLQRLATLDRLIRWQAVTEADANAHTRIGVATVTWQIAGGVGKITGSYRVELKRQSDRWFLAGVTAEMGATTP
ncbi:MULTISPECIES: conjugal transfer protein [unclassified Crossiella]|uniref:conjugal transfer protein n=1 Tax=unclassified Crossiella TaxID=2620835 RepID=UPI0020000ED5|nr:MULTISPECIES: conjugal transfer protein [unclassified Crossiella]MCK2239981.1 conjugal transfer protein [Crossiella sp. S99.2]MCK2252689.1 conjugal transfer protein [Crossiella sp. S99.1]